MSLQFYIVNAFTLPSSPYSGNQAAVVLLPLDHPRAEDDEWKLLTARDFNFAETAFVSERTDGNWGLRWWTPAVEVTLCGHATLAAAATLFSLLPTETSLTYTTRWSGDLIATRQPASADNDGKGQAISISLPTLDAETLSKLEDSNTSSTSTEVISLLELALPQLKDTGAVCNVFKFLFTGEDSAIIELDSSIDLAQLKPDIKAMMEIGKGLIILTQIIPEESSTGRLVIKSRVFAPGVGIDEDPVTGAAHAFLTAYYLSPTIYRRLPASVIEGRQPSDLVLDAYQLSQRQGRMACRLATDGRVHLTGRGVVWGTGHLNT